MILKTHTNNGALVAEIEISEANLSYAEALKVEMILLIDSKPKAILLDFNQVQYVDSTFLGAMVSSLKYAVANNTDISVFNLTDDIRNLFTLIRLDKVFKIYATEAEALESLNNK
jgi:anti-sigma B factor antagonist